MESLAAQFSAEDFSAVDWVNNALEGFADGDDSASRSGHGASKDGVESHIASLSARLQALASELEEDLEARMLDIYTALPRTLAEVERLEWAAGALAGELKQLTGSLDTLHDGTSAELELLSRLDLTRGNMDSSLATLREAAAWEGLVREVDAKSAAGDLAGVVESWEGMTRSIRVLAGMPGAAERERALADAQQRLESALRPKLQAALQQAKGGDADGAAAAVAQQVAVLAECVDLYRRVGQLDALQEDYTRARPAAVHKCWFAHGSEGGFPAWLPTFYSQVLAMLAEERRRAAELFGSAAAPAVLCQLVARTLQPVCASFTKRLRGAAAGAEWWPAAVAAFAEATLPFAAAVLEQLSGAAEPAQLQVLLSIVAPYRPIMDELGPAEAAHVTARLAPALRALTEPLADLPPEMLADPESAFLPRVEEVLELCRSAPELATAGAVERCMALTDGAQFAALLSVLDSSLASAYDACAAGVARVRSLCGILAAPPSPAAATPVPAFDWAFLQGGLQLLQTAGALQLNFETRERDLATAAARAAAALLWDGGAPPLLRAQGGAPPDPATLCSAVAHCRLQGRWPEPSADASGGSTDASGGNADGGGASGGGGEQQGPTALAAELEAARARAEALGTCGGLLGGGARAVRGVAASARGLVFDLCFCEVARGLGGSAAADAAAPPSGLELGDDGGAAAADGDAHCLPQPHVTRVGEHLLSLLQQLEAFATGAATASAARATQDLGALAHAHWRPLAEALQLPAPLAEALLLVADGAALAPYVLPDADGTHVTAADDADDAGSASSDAAAVQLCQDWLAALAGGAVGVFACSAVRGVARRGAAASLRQLGANAAYLENVRDALDLPPHPLLSHMARLLAMGRAEAAAALRRRDGALAPDSDDAALLVLRRVEQRLLGEGSGGAAESNVTS